ncbi:MAG: radical SAM protein [Parcubacteria group bacterium]
MENILLIYPPYTYTRKNPPLGLAYLAGALEKDGFKPKIIDMSAIGLDYSQLEKEIIELKPKIVGISFMTNQYGEMLKVAALVKKCDPKISTVVGGPHASALPEESLKNDAIDFVVVGEGENTLLELTKQIFAADFDLNKIKGLAFKNGEQIFINEKRPFIEKLDEIPLPAWHLLQIDKYSVLASGGDMNKILLPIISSRGCPNQCIFCDSHSIFGRCFRSRSAENILQEIILLKDKYGVTQFDFVDDTITVDKERIRKLCDLFLQNNLNIKWMCNARVNTVNPEILNLMKKAGCVRIDLGVESGDQSVLNAIKKGITLEQIKYAHKIAQDAGIQTNSFVMVGNLGENLASVHKTVDLICDFAEDINVAIATPFPGTELYQVAKKNGWLRVFDWSKYVTSPTYLPDYRPIMVTDKMDEKEIMKSFYFVHSRFVKKKFQARYGKYFYFNPKFYTNNLFKVNSFDELLHRGGMLFRLVFQLFKKI